MTKKVFGKLRNITKLRVIIRNVSQKNGDTCSLVIPRDNTGMHIQFAIVKLYITYRKYAKRSKTNPKVDE